MIEIDNADIEIKTGRSPSTTIGGTVKLLGQRLSNAIITVDDDGLSIKGGVSFDVSGFGKVGTEINLTLGESLRQSQASVAFDAFGSEVSLGKVSGDKLFDIPELIAEKMLDGVTVVADAAIEVLDTAVDAAVGLINQTAVGRYALNLAEGLISDAFSLFGDGLDLLSDGFDAVGLDFVSDGLDFAKDTAKKIGEFFGLSSDNENDTLKGDNGVDKLDGGKGNDKVIGKGGDDFLKGGSGSDRVSGGGGHDRIAGGSGNDYRLPGPFSHRGLYGGSGDDYIDGGNGRDYLKGDDGHDYLIGGGGTDYLHGGSGSDTADFSYRDGDIGLFDKYDGVDFYPKSGLTIDLDTNKAKYSVSGREESIPGIDNIIGSEGADTIKGDSGRNYLNGNSNSDTIEGRSNNDVLDGGSGHDTLKGGSGHDVLIGGTGKDSFYGGSGNDTVDFSYAGSRGGDIDLSKERAVFRHSEVVKDVENVIGSKGKNKIIGDSKDNILDGLNNNDTLYGGGGNDVLKGGSGHDKLYGESGNDVLIAGTGNDKLDGGDDIDTADYSDTSTDITANLGTGKVYVAGHTDTLTNVENLKGTKHADTITGNGESNTLDGYKGDDIIDGAGGNDVLKGGRGDDILSGGAGNDYLDGGKGKDNLDGGAGNDTADYSHGTIGATFRLTEGTVKHTGRSDIDETITNIENLIGTTKRDIIYGDNSDEGNVLDGYLGNDFIAGRGGDDIINGGKGNDTLHGERGDDILFGTEGSDTVYGGSGNDILYGNFASSVFLDGGTDGDTFVLDLNAFKIGTSNTVIINDFSASDRIMLLGSSSRAIKLRFASDGIYYDGTSSRNKIISYGSDSTDYLRSLDDDQLTIANGKMPSWQINAGSSKTSNKYIEGAYVFFDANLNGIRDDNEPFTYSNEEGTYAFGVDLMQFDLNGDGTLEANEGQLISQGGTDTYTGLRMSGAFTAPSSYRMITPVTTLVNMLAQAEGDIAAAELMVNQALGFTDTIDLGYFDPIAEMEAGNAEGAQVMAAHVAISTIIEQTSSLLLGAANSAETTADLDEFADGLQDSISSILVQQLTNSGILDLTDANQVQNVLTAAVTTAQTQVQEANWQQVIDIAPQAAQVMANNIQAMTDILQKDKTDSQDPLRQVSQLQAYLLEETTQELGEAAAGELDIAEVLANNSLENILTLPDEEIFNYLASNPELIAAVGTDAAAVKAHYAEFGFFEGLGTDTFEADRYIASNPDLVETLGYDLEAATQHFVNEGYAAGRTANTFIPELYLQSYPELQNSIGRSRTGATYHYIAVGHAEGHDPWLAFNAVAYVGANPELLDTLDIADKEAIKQHYIAIGYPEGLKTTFDTDIDLASNPDLIEALGFDNALTGDSENNILKGLRGNDIILGGAGNDHIQGGRGADTMDGGTGINTLRYNKSDTGVNVDLERNTASGGHAEGDSILNFDRVKGSGFDDSLIGNYGNNTLVGLDGDDIINGGAGNDHIRGGSGADTMDGGTGTNTLRYDDSNAGVNIDLENNTASGGHAEGDSIANFDRVKGSKFNDFLIGNQRNNTLVGLDGDDIINGGAGNDHIRGGSGADTMDGGTGTNTLRYDNSNAGVNIDLENNTASGGHAEGDSIANFDRVVGSEFNDSLTGNHANNTLTGLGGDDVITGGAGRDTLRGGQGRDILTGGEGIDRFDYQALSDSLLNNFDVITDFEIGTDRFNAPVKASVFVADSSVASLTENAIQSVLGSLDNPTAHFSDEGAAVSLGTTDGRTFIVINDSTAGFQANSDLIVEITGFSGELGQLSIS